MKFRSRVLLIDAEQWFPGADMPTVITDPKALVGEPWAHAGHQRELDGNTGIVATPDGPEFVHPGDWIIVNAKGERRVYEQGVFEATFVAMEGDS